MITSAIPKLPMRDPAATRNYYSSLGFVVTGDYGDYLLMEKDQAELHFFIFKALNPAENYGQVYLKVQGIEALYEALLEKGGRLDIEDKYGNEPLWYAVFFCRGIRYELVDLFLKNGANPNHKNKNNRTPLDFANCIENNKLVKMLNEYCK